jgi:hypothetical protein
LRAGEDFGQPFDRHTRRVNEGIDKIVERPVVKGHIDFTLLRFAHRPLQRRPELRLARPHVGVLVFKGFRKQRERLNEPLRLVAHEIEERLSEFVGDAADGGHAAALVVQVYVAVFDVYACDHGFPFVERKSLNLKLASSNQYIYYCILLLISCQA